VLTSDGDLREIVATSTQVDPNTYRLPDYPATAAALRDGVMLEVHVDESSLDPDERAVLHRLGMASLLLVPLILDHKPFGILEMFYASRRRWTGRDIDNARILAQHVLHALGRVTPVDLDAQ
jgi:GAF domain-containing protein